MTSDSATVRSDQKVTLTASATASVTSTSALIEIFDLTVGNQVGVCARSNRCVVSYAADGATHAFSAFIASPSSRIPGAGEAYVSSNAINVTWLGATISSDASAVGPGHAITLTARANIDVARSGHLLEIRDSTSNTVVTYCSQGTTCTTSVTMPSSGLHSMVASLSGQPEVISSPLAATWLSVTLVAGPPSGNSVHLTASANADLTKTPWSIGIYDRNGTLLGPLCKAGYACTAAGTAGGAPFSAAVGEMLSPGLGGKVAKMAGIDQTLQILTNIQARSAAVGPAHYLWGVDSCKAMSIDGMAGRDLYADVNRHLGAPSFWGRYLTNTICPGLSSLEIATAHHLGLGILPIYNEYNCSNVAGYATGRAYGGEASAAAAGLGIPKGTALAIDIEPPGDACPGAANVDSGFIQGWYDGVNASGFPAAYYGNGTPGTEFATAWCNAVSPSTGRPEIAGTSYLWSFEPSLIHAGGKANPPAFGPYETGCGGNAVAWQYMIGDYGPNIDIDMDILLTSFPLWYP